MKRKQLPGKKIVVLENGLISSYTMREALMDELLRNNFDVYILTQTNQFRKEVESRGLKVVNIGSANTNIFKIGSYIFKLFWQIRKIKPDLCLTFSVRPAIWGNLIAGIFHVPVITNISGLGQLASSKNIAYRFVRAVYPLALSKTSKVFFQNKEDLKFFISRKFINSKQADWIPGSGIDYHKFAPFNVSRDKSKFVFLFIGRLIRDKGISEFIEAAGEIKKNYPETIFRIIGPLWHQNLKSNLISESQIESWTENREIQYLGEKKDVRQFIAEADCIVLPSYREGISNVLLEGASMEKPAIATNVPGCKEVVEDGTTGYLCKPGDTGDLIDKMILMLHTSESERKNMGQLAREKVILEFDKKIVVNKYLTEINQLFYQKSNPRYLTPVPSPNKEEKFRFQTGMHMAG